MATRQMVTGRYLNPSTYVLCNEDGSEFQTIREGEGFKIGNQLRMWYPIKVKKRRGKGTILMCQKFGDGGNVIEEFPLIHNKRGLWALTSGAARNGVFHNYHAPQSRLEELCIKMGISYRDSVKRLELDQFDRVVYDYNRNGYRPLVKTDGREETFETGTRISNASYVLIIDQDPIYLKYRFNSVILGKDVDERVIINILRRYIKL